LERLKKSSENATAKRRYLNLEEVSRINTDGDLRYTRGELAGDQHKSGSRKKKG